ncbi:HD domain-containing protein [Maridesulfovibrio sp.]|uniref:HD domain-containing protein n=1 Tax=Maridesulfovibrio sp. TaxID=2795000 RepID=UPI002A18B4F8|nr:HD domain-containing protein [Maridesulfovibrio sp.]
MSEIPNREQCEKLLAEHSVSGKVINHCAMVHDVALRIGRDLKWLRDRGPNLALISAAAMLHDIAKGQPDHAEAGAKILRSHGLQAVADIVGAHNDLDFSGEAPVTEKEIVFIADKLVKGEQMVTVAYIYDHKIEACSNDPDTVAILKRMKAVAMRIKSSIEQETGKNLEELAIAEN